MERAGAEEPIPLAVQASGIRGDARVAYPRRISEHEIEAPRGHHMRKMNFERKEIDLGVFHAIEHFPRIEEPFAEHACGIEILMQRIAKEIAPGRGNELQLALI